MRLRYKNARAVDGDTIELSLTSGPKWIRRQTIRIVGIDTCEMTSEGEKGRKALAAKEYLSNELNRWFKPKIEIDVYMSRTKYPVVRKDRHGRILGTVKVFKWRGYKDYAEVIKEKGLHKKGSKWNI